MKRRTLEAKRVAASSPVQLTLDVLQKRLNDAESQAKTLGKHLEKYGFKHAGKIESSVSSKDGKEETKAPTRNQTERGNSRTHGKLEKNYEEMATRVCKMESTIQSLKTGLRGVEAERSVLGDKNDEKIADLKQLHQTDITEYEKKISKLNSESNELKRDNKEMEKEIEKLIKELKEIESARAERFVDQAEMEGRIEKLVLQKNQLTEDLQREISLRQSLEEAHEALLQRVKDMESVVDTERNQVNELVHNWDNTRQAEAATKEAFENEHELRMQLEALVSQQENNFISYKERLKEISEEKKLLEVDSAKFRKENATLKNQFGITKKAYEELKVAYDNVMKDSQKLHSALKIAATDNKALITQHKDTIQREKEKVNAKLIAHDQMLDSAKDAILKELERQKAVLRNTEQENVDLKSSVKVLERKLENKDDEIKACRKKFDSEITQLNFIADSLRKDNELIVQDKNERILKLQKNIDELNNENSNKELNINQMKLDIQRLQTKANTTENEKTQLITRLQSAEHAQLSQKQIEEAMTEMMQAKNKLAYENGVLQSRLEQLSLDLSNQSTIKAENSQLREKNQALQNQYNKVVSELRMTQNFVKEKSSEITNLKEDIGKKETNIKQLITSREGAMQETQKLLVHMQSLEETYKNKIFLAENAMEIAKADNKKLAQSFEGVMQSHSQLQSSVEELQTRLGRKDTEIENHIQERSSTQKIVAELQEEMASLQKTIFALQSHDSEEMEGMRKSIGKVENQNKALQKSLETAKDEKKQLKQDYYKQESEFKKKIKELLDDIEKRKLEEQKQIENQNKEVGHFEDLYNKEMKEKHELREELKLSLKKLKTSEQENLTRKKKLKKLKGDFHSQQEQLSNYQLDHEEQANVIREMVVEIKRLETELKARHEMQTQSTTSIKQFEDEIEEEKCLRLEAESRCMTLKSREQDLERKLENANRTNIKVSNDLKDAQIWFHRKVVKLEKELQNAKQTQYILEQTATEQEKLTEDEKQKSEEAKRIVRASRMAVSQLANEMTENLWETKGLKHVIQAEREFGVKAAQKYDRLMESSARKVEELARELDRAHDKARKAR